jgi:hypothetical protein
MLTRTCLLQDYVNAGSQGPLEYSGPAICLKELVALKESMVTMSHRFRLFLTIQRCPH